MAKQLIDVYANSLSMGLPLIRKTLVEAGAELENRGLKAEGMALIRKAIALGDDTSETEKLDQQKVIELLLRSGLQALLSSEGSSMRQDFYVNEGWTQEKLGNWLRKLTAQSSI